MAPTMQGKMDEWAIGNSNAGDVSLKPEDLIEQAGKAMLTIKENKADKTEQFTEATMSLVKVHSLLLKKELTKKRVEQITKHSVENQTIELFCEVCVEILKSGEHYRYPGIDTKYIDLLNRMLLYLVNTTDNNYELSGIIARETGFLTMVIEKLQEWKGYCFGCERNMKIEEGRHILGLLCNVMHNISVFEDYVPNLRDVNCIEAMKPYLESKDNRIQLLCLATLADLVTESECEILKSNDESIRILISTISDVLKTDNDGWSVKELVKILQHVARNDNNKKVIVKNGAVPVLMEIINKEIVEDQLEAVCAIWELSFDIDIREQMVQNKEWKVKDTLDKLSASTDKEHEELKNNSKNALWTITSKHHRKSDYKNKSSGNNGHTMISYNWGYKEMVQQINNSLENSGITTWIDTDKMHETSGSIYEAMAAGVEQADIVLICYSSKYKNSRNCRAEAEYAFELGKRIIPLKMENNYVPDGWLGLIIRSQLYYDFSGEYAPAEKVRELIKAIQYDLNNKRRAEVLEHTVQSRTKTKIHGESMLTSENEPKKTIITRNWSCGEVQQWLKDTYILKESTSTVKKTQLEALSGKHVVFLKMLYRECPTTFYKTISEQLSMQDLASQTDFRLALEDINVDLQTAKIVENES